MALFSCCCSYIATALGANTVLGELEYSGTGNLDWLEDLAVGETALEYSGKLEEFFGRESWLKDRAIGKPGGG